jgi:hypothetical protein
LRVIPARLCSAIVSVRNKLSLSVLLVSFGWLGGGCGGLSASHSVSPATFLVPGIMRSEPPKVPPATPTVPVQTAGLSLSAPVLN